MKKSILKVLASMLVLAMAITTVVIPNVTAKASEQTEIILVLSEATDNTVLLNIGDHTATLTPDATKDTTSLPTWGGDFYPFTKDSSNPKVYRITVNGTIGADEYSNIQFVFAQQGKGVKYYPQHDRDTWNNNDKLYFQIDTSNISWQELVPSTTDPLAATASDVMAKIDAIGTVELSDACKAKIETARGAVDTYSGNASDITNIATLTAAEAEWNRLTTAAAGELVLHVKTSWTNPKLYGWDGASLGAWPGTAIPADENNAGWYTITTTLTAPGSLIINDGAGNQASDWKYVSSGEIWVTMDGTNYTTSKTAPEGWSTGAQTPNPTPTPDPDPIPEEGDFDMVLPLLLVLFGGVAVVFASKKRFA